MEQMYATSIIEPKNKPDGLSGLRIVNDLVINMPDCLGDFRNVTTLKIECRALCSLPESLGNLTDLINLDISRSCLTSLPESIGNLINLKNLIVSDSQLENLPDSIGNLVNLINLNISGNQLKYLPDSIGNLVNLTSLNISNTLDPACHVYFNHLNSHVVYTKSNQIDELPESIGNLVNLTILNISNNCLKNLSESISSFTKLKKLDLSGNRLVRLPESIGNLSNLIDLWLTHNQINILPESISNLAKLSRINLDNNPLSNLSKLQSLPNLREVVFLDSILPHRYWTKFSDWKSEWLLDEENAEIRRILIEQIGYEKICEELNAIHLDSWREYILLKIHGIQPVYTTIEYIGSEAGGFIDGTALSHREPMVLLKMTCPSTQHIHILRVPPEMNSAEAAITWVNHGIHPDEIAVQT
jgi:leucine-rich repeat protein SHOC2